MVWHKNKIFILVQFEDEPQGFLSGHSDNLFLYRRLLTTLWCDSWCGGKRAASLREGGATAYTAAAWFER